MITRRQFAASTPLLAASALALPGCSAGPVTDGYDAVAERTWQLGSLTNLDGAALGRELVRCATLAPSSHNTQCWKFALDANGSSISTGVRIYCGRCRCIFNWPYANTSDCLSNKSIKIASRYCDFSVT